MLPQMCLLIEVQSCLITSLKLMHVSIPPWLRVASIRKLVSVVTDVSAALAGLRHQGLPPVLQSHHPTAAASEAQAHAPLGAQQQ